MDTCEDIVFSLLEIPFSRRNDIERSIILQQGRPTPKFALLQKEKGRTRTFKSSWYDQHKWLCGSTTKETLFCWPCVLLSSNKGVWSSEGYSDMKNLARAVVRHSSSKDHLNCYVAFKGLSKQALNVSEMLDEQNRLLKIKYNEEVKRNREIFKLLIDVTCVLAAQELAFRGHNETECSLNPGNFKSIFDLVLSRNVELKHHWESMGYFRGVSKTIQNELIDCIQEEIQGFIEKKINNAPFFACIVDETIDITEISQCSVAVRLVDSEGEIQEYFLGFHDVNENRNAEGLCNVLRKVLEKYNVENKLVAQTYDGASVMAGELNGLKAKVKEFAPQALFTHCFAHRLNLVLQQSCSKIKSVKIFFSTLHGIPAFFHRSSKRTAVLDRIVGQRIPTSSEVRWNSNTKIISAVYNNRVKLIEAFEDIINSPDSSGNTAREAQGFKSNLANLNFVFLLLTFEDIFQKTELLFNILQKKTNDVQMCINAVSDCILYMKNLRSDQQYSVFMESAETATQSDSLNILKTRRHESMEDSVSYKYKQVYFEILDNILTQLEVRFSNYEKLQFLKLGDTTQFLKYSTNFPTDALDSLMESYGSYFDREKLRVELQTVFSPLHKETFQGMKTLGELIKKMIESETNEILEDAFKLFCLIATIPATSASVERSFSCLNRIKTFLRNSMTQERLSALASVSIEKGILKKLQSQPTWHDELIDRFAKKKYRRVILLCKY